MYINLLLSQFIGTFTIYRDSRTESYHTNEKRRDDRSQLLSDITYMLMLYAQ